MAYRLTGKQQTISFGPYPNVSLAEARAKRAGLKAQLQEGADPMASRKANRDALSFKDAVLQYWAGRQLHILFGFLQMQGGVNFVFTSEEDL